MSYNQLLKGRFSQANRAYFVTTVTHERRKLFESLNIARIVIQTMKLLNEESYVNSLCWVVMPDHLHWLFQLESKETLSDVIKRLKAVSAHNINGALKRRGAVWQKAYYDRGLRDEEDLKQLSRYIVANPLRAGLVKNIGDYSHWDTVWI